MAINVILHRVLIKREEAVDTEAVKTKKEVERLGLQVPDWVKNNLDGRADREKASMDRGKVVQIGELAFRDYGIACPIREGDLITFAKFGGKEVTDPATGELYVIINDEDVVAVLTEKEPLDG